MRPIVAASCLAFAASSAIAQGGDRSLAFSLDRTGPPLARYTLTVHEDGAGTYLSQAAPDPSGKVPGAVAQTAPLDIHISPLVVKKLFAAVPTVEGGRCETHSKGLAKTGVKILHYVGAGRNAQCTYNYSDDERVNEATQMFEAVAETLQYGDRLAAKLRFDRLGLDAELEGLENAVKEGRALEVNNIAPVLRTIDSDERVMDRVHRKVERLLQQGGPGQGSLATDASDR